jgi:F0F1-type ATP synthase assembly protein I
MNAPEKPDEAGESRRRGASGILKSVVQAERLIQLALVLPAATLIGWAIGMGLDRWLGHHWISIAGLLVGAIAGFVEVFRVVATLSKTP